MADKPLLPNRPLFQALALAWDLGYTIAIPLVVLALLGRLADRYLNTSPWLLLTGVLLSIVVSSWLIIKKTKYIMAGSERESAASSKGEEIKS
ncbi:MAG: AtpZ/AtpI family protein [Candidatus Kerfeldbacteria bacterium]|nr:AtpZ/AtpI family protein [Candidatus Kerfeldbacteria bacterium]